MYIKYSSDRLKYKDDDWKLLRFNPLCESKSFSIESNRVVQRYPNNKHRRVSYRIQNFLLEPLRDERGRGKEINKEYNFVRVIHRSSTPCALIIRSIDRYVEFNWPKTQERRKNKASEKSRVSHESYEDGIARATCSHMYPRTTTGSGAGEIAALTIHSTGSPPRNGTGRRIFLVNIYPYSSEEIDP